MPVTTPVTVVWAYIITENNEAKTNKAILFIGFVFIN